MADAKLIDQAYHLVMSSFVEKGQAPHFTEFAKTFQTSPEESKQLLHDLLSSGVPAWAYPDTDYISSFAPFNNLPTQYRITVEGQQLWFAQWGFEALAVCWLFPGKIITIDAPCLDCGQPMQVQVQDGVIKGANPEGMFAFIDVPFSKWRDNLAYSWSRMNLFRSEEHVKNWSGYRNEAKGGMMPLSDMMSLFGVAMFRERFSNKYVSNLAEYRGEFIGKLGEITDNNPFWAIA